MQTNPSHIIKKHHYTVAFGMRAHMEEFLERLPSTKLGVVEWPEPRRRQELVERFRTCEQIWKTYKNMIKGWTCLMCTLQSKSLCCDNWLADLSMSFWTLNVYLFFFFQAFWILVLTKIYQAMNLAFKDFFSQLIPLCVCESLLCLSHFRFCGRSPSIPWLPTCAFSSVLRTRRSFIVNLTCWISLPRGCRWNFQHYIFEGC